MPHALLAYEVKFTVRMAAGSKKILCRCFMSRICLDLSSAFPHMKLRTYSLHRVPSSCKLHEDLSLLARSTFTFFTMARHTVRLCFCQKGFAEDKQW